MFSTFQLARMASSVSLLSCSFWRLIIILLLLYYFPPRTAASQPSCSIVESFLDGQQFPQQQLLFDPEYKAQFCDRQYDVDPNFPDTFQFGASSSAHQIEGAWNVDGRTPDIWDDLMHRQPELFNGKVTSDVGTDSYHQYGQDIEALKAVGVINYYDCRCESIQ